jgi:hypothetical protein
MKSYKVWIAVEKYDSKTGEGISVEEQLMFCETAEFKTFAKAEQFAERLHETGKQLAKETA